ncbi:hypothetical protein BZL41_26480 [Pseudomonas sp. PIC25]|uniref:hypothetical protein n=1 Tax=Pseudomonas sp. PIC25 TaxID=1958773 RepID=UPI000BAB791C|nr:hypothetical protein [Pseudomonas sp. PIC25]PAU51978.1 hypothetical protein BZL41_26480 [Pseudomonas sp. PIC25]
MRHWKTLTLLPLLAALTACDNGRRVTEQLCRAEYRYNTAGADAAIATIRELGDDRDYVVGNNVARFLILRGASTQNVQDFDEAKSILDSTETFDDPDHVIAWYVSILRFLAKANGSDSSSARQELTQHCRESVEPESECLKASMMDIFDRIGRTNGTTNKSFQDLADLFNRAYRSEFDDPTLDVKLDYSRSVVTDCGTYE